MRSKVDDIAHAAKLSLSSYQIRLDIGKYDFNGDIVADCII